ncbi:MAG: hypothetical protein F6K23_08745 [Okeania sp. SIO2C9]|uniref:hypothetical protein n=1 Tax=Okeania sp. SIO2C9 TaxID=2607791 RepID=UPI0013BF6307|nr:hypothetical protein [Okeania sp. SIO2C9]NEQ73156.1 hypothetical protein [Okeania sp. SIO2C9]
MSGSIGIVSAKVRKKEEGRRKREEGRGKKEEGRRKREEGRGKKEEAGRLRARKKLKFPVDIYPWVYTNAPQRT